MVIIALAAAVLVIFGGYVATLKADFLQGFIMIFGVLALIVVVFRSQQVGGLTAGLKAISAETASLNLTAKDHIGLWATVLMTSFGTWGLPQMIHKYYGIKDKIRGQARRCDFHAVRAHHRRRRLSHRARCHTCFSLSFPKRAPIISSPICSTRPVCPTSCSALCSCC